MRYMTMYINFHMQEFETIFWSVYTGTTKFTLLCLVIDYVCIVIEDLIAYVLCFMENLHQLGSVKLLHRCFQLVHAVFDYSNNFYTCPPR